jgi:hypothetical protein
MVLRLWPADQTQLTEVQVYEIFDGGLKNNYCDHHC